MGIAHHMHTSMSLYLYTYSHAFTSEHLFVRIFDSRDAVRFQELMTPLEATPAAPHYRQSISSQAGFKASLEWPDWIEASRGGPQSAPHCGLGVGVDQQKALCILMA